MASIASCDQHPGGGCEVNVRWHPPTDTEATMIMHYVIIEFPWEQNTTTNGSETHAVLNIENRDDLDNKTISILAIDSCGREGSVSSPFNLADLFVVSTTHTQTTREIIPASYGIIMYVYSEVFIVITHPRSIMHECIIHTARGWGGLTGIIMDSVL